jgi:hypothetical protein
MEKFNFKGGENILKSICWILSYLSWLLVTVNNLASLKYMYKESRIWGIAIDEENSHEYIPIQMDRIVIYIVYNIWILISFIGCVVFIVKTLFRKDNSVIDGMMGKFSQFHFIPLLFAFTMSLLGELSDTTNQKKIKNITYTGLVFSLLGLISMVFIYINTSCESVDRWAKYFLKNGTFSCLIVLFWYNFCYDIYSVRYADKPEKDNSKWLKGCSLAFSIIFGVGTIAFSFVFKDIMISFMNILIYFGMTKNYFALGVTYVKEKNKSADGAIDCIMLVCSLILFVYLLDENSKGQSSANLDIEKLRKQIYDIANVQNQTIVKVNANSERIKLIGSNPYLTSKS